LRISGQKVEIRFTLSWFFPHHLTTDGHEMGHMDANWYRDAAGVNRYLCAHDNEHRVATESFARTIADTSCGGAMSFAWSSQLSTLVFNTWWIKDGSCAIWEGLGCCGLSTTDCGLPGKLSRHCSLPRARAFADEADHCSSEQLGTGAAQLCGQLRPSARFGFPQIEINGNFLLVSIAPCD
jgi:uncharacterized protein (DUF608 family)